MRYQYVTPIRDANNNIGTFDPNLGMVQQSSSSSLWSGDHRDFEPRLGFAWDLSGKGIDRSPRRGQLDPRSLDREHLHGSIPVPERLDVHFRRPDSGADYLQRLDSRRS